MIPKECIEVQTSPLDRPSVPAWFAEVVMMVRHLASKGLLEAFARAGCAWSGVASGAMSPSIFSGRWWAMLSAGSAPWLTSLSASRRSRQPLWLCLDATVFPIAPALCRFLADVDRPCVEAFRTLFEQHSFADGWTAQTIGGIFDRQGRRYIVFDVDATRQAARQRALPCGADLPPAQRRLDAVCAPGYRGRKRGEVVRTRTTALQMHTRQWVGTYAGKGNGDYRDELARARRSITTYLKHFAFPPEAALVRLEGAYGDATVVAQLLLAGTPSVPRWRGYLLLEHPQIQRVLAHGPTASMTRINSGVVVELFEGGWVELGEGLAAVRVMVARHPAPPAGQEIPVGKRIGEWVYELFITTLGTDNFLVEDGLDLYHGRGAFEGVLADEDVEEDPDRWCSYTECGQELWQIACQWLWNLRLSLGQTMQGVQLRDIEWAPAKEAPPLLVEEDSPPEEYGPWQWAAAFGRAMGLICAEDFVEASRTGRCAAQRGPVSG
jgi:hypothetical protein